MYREKQKDNWLWDTLAARFDTHLDERDIHPDAAVNIHIGWPIFFDQIETQVNFLGKKHLDILDFGCGVGSLCLALYKKGHNLTGIDYSSEMIAKAKAVLPKEIELYEGSHESSIFEDKFFEKYDVITAMHVFDWMRDKSKAIKILSQSLKDGGILIFSVFPEKHIIDSLKIKDLFENFDSVTKPRKGYANFDGVIVPVYLKSAHYYDKLCKKMELEKILEYYPPYHKNFLNKYKWTGSLYPEMLILVYRKIKN